MLGEKREDNTRSIQFTRFFCKLEPVKVIKETNTKVSQRWTPKKYTLMYTFSSFSQILIQIVLVQIVHFAWVDNSHHDRHINHCLMYTIYRVFRKKHPHHRVLFRVCEWLRKVHKMPPKTIYVWRDFPNQSFLFKDVYATNKSLHKCSNFASNFAIMAIWHIVVHENIASVLNTYYVRTII